VAWLERNRYEVEFEAEAIRLAAAANELEPLTPVPTCPEWTVRDLVGHVGTGHRWSTQIVAERLQTPPDYVVLDPPAHPADWAEWLVDGTRGLVEAIRTTGADEPVWTWQSDRTAAFWLRKMLHDEVVHRFDAELAGGRLGDLAADVGADGISDMLTSIATLSPTDSPDPIFAGLVGAGETLQFVAIDAEPSVGQWHVVRTPAGVHWQHRQAPADVTVRAPARELLLMLNRRLDAAQQGVQISGDRALFTHWLDHSQF